MPPRITPRKALVTRGGSTGDTVEVCFRGLPSHFTDAQLMDLLRPYIGSNVIGVTKRSAIGDVFFRVSEHAVASVIRELDGLEEIDGVELSSALQVTQADVSSPSLPLRKSSTPCIHWQKGRCREGTACRFAHGAATPSGIGLAGPCFAFQKGNCPHGVSCKFSHDTNALSSPGSHEQGSIHERKKEVVHPCFNYVKGTCTNGDACNYSHDPQLTGGPRPCFNFQKGLCTRGADCTYSHSRESACYSFGKGNCTRGDECEFSHETSGPRPCYNFQRGICTRGADCHFSHETHVRKQIKLSKEVDNDIKLLARKLLNSISGGKFAYLVETFEEDFHSKQSDAEEVVRKQLEVHRSRLHNISSGPSSPKSGEKTDSLEHLRRIGFGGSPTTITVEKKGHQEFNTRDNGREVPFSKSGESTYSSLHKGRYADTEEEDKNHWGKGSDRERNNRGRDNRDDRGRDDRDDRGRDDRDDRRKDNREDGGRDRSNGTRDRDGGEREEVFSSRSNDRKDSREKSYYNEQSSSDSLDGDGKRDEYSYREKRPRERTSASDYQSRESDRDYESYRDEKRARTSDDRYYNDTSDHRRNEEYDRRRPVKREDESDGRSSMVDYRVKEERETSHRRSRSSEFDNYENNISRNNTSSKDDRDQRSVSKRGDLYRRSNSRESVRDTDSRRSSSQQSISSIHRLSVSKVGTPLGRSLLTDADGPPGMTRVASSSRSFQDLGRLLSNAEDALHRGFDPLEEVGQVARNLGLNDQLDSADRLSELLTRGEVSRTMLDRFSKLLEQISASKLVEVRGVGGSIEHVRADNLLGILTEASRSSKQQKLITLTNDLKDSNPTSRSSVERSTRSPHLDRWNSPSKRDRSDKRLSSPIRADFERDRPQSDYKKDKLDKERPIRSVDKRRRSRSFS